MNSETPAPNRPPLAVSAQQRDTAAVNPPAPLVSLPPSCTSGAIGCVFAGLAIRVGDRSAADYAEFLEEL